VHPRSAGGSPELLPLPRSVRPFPGEALASYVDRQAHFLRIPLLSALHRLGLTDEQLVSSIENGYGIFLSSERMLQFARINKLSEAEVRGMLLMQYDDACLDLSLATAQPGSWQSVALREWAYFSGSHVCPDCIRETDGAWQTAWKLPWTFACLKHQVLLLDTCPACGERPASWRSDKITRPNFTRRVPLPGACSNARPGSGKRGRGSQPCGCDFRTTLAEPMKSTVVLEAQAWVNVALDSRRGVVADRSLSANEFFAVLRGISSLLLYAGKPELLESAVGPDAPPELLEAFKEHLLRRNEVEAERDLAVGAGSSGSRRPRAKVAGKVPGMCQ
jgi:hypothetical protein